MPFPPQIVFLCEALEETKSRSSCAALSEVSLLLYQLSGKAGTTSEMVLLLFFWALFGGELSETLDFAAGFLGDLMI